MHAAVDDRSLGLSRWARFARVAIVLGAALVVTTCDVGKLLQAPPPPGLAVVPVQLADSAAVGSAAPRVTSVHVSAAGAGTPSWTLSRAGGSAWLVPSVTGGTVPATVDLTLNPVGLPLGVYRDTLLLAVTGGQTDPTRVPVLFTIYPCQLTTVAPDTIVQGDLTTADCGAPHRSGRFARVYQFDASANDSITAVLGSSAFASYVVLDSVPQGAVLAESPNCLGLAGAACLRYVRLPRTGSYALGATTVDSGATGAFTLQLTRPRPPSAPGGLVQLRRDTATALVTGGVLPDSVVVLRAVMADPDSGDSLRLEVEVRRDGEAFAATPTDSSAEVVAGTAAVVVVSHLPDNTTYRWKARARDYTGRAGPWVAFGANADSAADFATAVPQPPAAPAQLAQLKSDATTPLVVGGTTDEQSVTLRAGVTDPDPGDALRLDVEVQPVATAFTGTPTASSPAVASGAVATVAVAGLNDDTPYHWQARVVDRSGLTSAWTAFGGNAESAADFRVAVPATHLAFLVQPSHALPGAVLAAIEVEALEASGLVDTASTAAVSVAIAAGTGTTGAVLSGTRQVTVQHGVATFSDLAVDAQGSGYRLSATASGLTPATSDTFSIAAGPVATLEFAQQPTNTAAGQAIAPAVRVVAHDADGNVATSFGGTVTIAIASGTGAPGAALAGTASVAAVSGVATFSDLSIDLVGTGYQLSASTPTLPSVTSTAFQIFASNAVALQFVVQPVSIVAGATMQPSVQVRAVDAQGNVATGFAGNITLGITPGTGTSGATLGGTAARTATAGVATFDDLTVTLVGTGYTLGAVSGALTAATSNAFAVTPGGAATLSVGGVADPVTAGTATGVTVTARDAYGNVATGYTGTIHFTSTDGAATLPANYTFTAGDAGVHAFAGGVTLRTVGEQTVTATDVVSGTITGSQSAITVQTAGTGTLVVSGIADPVTAGAGASVTLTARDTYGNVATSYTGTVHFTSSDPQAVLPADYTFTGADAGVHTFTGLVTLKTAGEQSVTATDQATSSITGSQTAITVQAGAAASLTFSGQPGNVTAGAAFSPPVMVPVLDSYNNVVTGYGTAVTVAIGTNPGGGTLSGNASATPTAGVATFSSLSINRTGTGYTLAASSGGLTATSAAFNVTPGAATHLVFSQQPTSVVAGATIAPAVTVSALDALNNVATGYTTNIALALSGNPGGGTLSGGGAVTPVSGVATFGGLAVNRTGTGYTLVANAASGGLSVISAAFNVTAGPPDHLAFTTEPGNTVAGSSIAPPVQVAVQDVNGNTVDTSSAAITVAIGTNPVGGTLSGTTTVGASSGVATFDSLTINEAGNGYTLTANGAGRPQITSSAFNIEVGSGNRLAFVQQPSGAVVGGTITPAVQVAIQDGSGNTVTTATDSVTLLLSNNPGGAALGGTTWARAVSGIATFSNIQLNHAGTGYTLAAVGSQLLPATSAAFNISAAATATAITLDAPDPSVTWQSDTVAYAVSVSAPGSGSPAGTVTVSDGLGDSCAGAVGDTGGRCTLALAATGAKTLTATYAGNADFSGSTSAGEPHTVNKASTTTTITSDSPDPSVTGQQITVAYSVPVLSPGGGTATGNVTVTDGTDSCSADASAGSCVLTLTTAGSKTLTATYAGSTDYSGSSGNATHLVNRAASATAVASSANPSVSGQAVRFTATVTSAGGAPTGAVQFQADGVNLGTPVTLVGDTAISAATDTLTVATHTITVTYAGDANFAGSSATLGAGQVVNKAATTTAITTDLSAATTVGQGVTVTYSVSATAPGAGTRTGTVVVGAGSDQCTGSVAANGTGSCPITFTSAGAKQVTAVYGGDGNFSGSTSAGVAHTVNAAATTTTVASSANPAVFGQAVSFTAAVTSAGGTPTGTVQFQVDAVNLGTPVTLVAGSATSPGTSGLSVGTHVVTATYAGDANFSGSSGTLAGGQVVTAASTTTTVASSANPSVFGQGVSFTAAVASAAGTPTGTVQFQVDAVNLGTPVTLVAGSATSPGTSGLGVGTHVVTATYAGDANFSGSSGTLAGGQVVNQAATTTTITTDLSTASAVGDAVPVAYQVSVTAPGAGTPTGSVTVAAGADTCTGAVVSDGTGSCPLTFTTSGVKTVTATYAGDTNFSGSASGGTTHTVTAGATTTVLSASANPSVWGESLTFTATVTGSGGTPTGNVRFQVDGSNLGMPVTLASGSATSVPTSTLSVGTHVVTAQYLGGTDYLASLDTLDGGQVVNRAATATAITTNLSVATAVGDSVSVAYTVTATAPGAGTPTGNVTVSDGTDSCPGTVAGGSCVLISTTAGAKTVTATYVGDPNFSGSASAGTAHTVSQATSSTSLVSSVSPSVFGQGVTFTATVSSAGGTPTGAVQFQVDAVNLGTPVTLASGSATSPAVSTLSVGTHAVTATYAGDANFTGSSGTLAGGQTVNRAATTTTITSDLATASIAGDPVTVVFAVAASPPGSGTPTGDVTVSDGVDSCSATLSSGTASCDIALTTAGARTLTASYAGDGNYVASASSGTAHQVDPGPANADSTTAVVPAGTANSLTTITITVRDAYNNIRTGGGDGGLLTVVVGGTNAGATVTLTDNHDGTYAATYTPALSGTDVVTIQLSGADIGGSPYSGTIGP